MPRKAKKPVKASRAAKPTLEHTSNESNGIIIEGDMPEAERCSTGLYSLDRALSDGKGNVGLPLRSMIEIAGSAGVGKSTLTYYLAGKVADFQSGTIALADFEGLDRNYLSTMIAPSGYTGRVRLISLSEGKNPGSAESMLNSLYTYLSEPETAACILDSVGAIIPIAEIESAIGDSHVAIRARLMADMSRRTIYQLRMKEKPASMFLVNHVHMVIGGQGSVTSGGVAIGYLCGVRLRIWVDEHFDDGSYTMAIKVEKSRYGPWRTEARILVKAGYGVHPGLTSVLDCIKEGIAQKERTITLNGKSCGFFSRLLEQYDDPEVFQPFQDALVA